MPELEDIFIDVGSKLAIIKNIVFEVTKNLARVKGMDNEMILTEPRTKGIWHWGVKWNTQNWKKSVEMMTRI